MHADARSVRSENEVGFENEGECGGGGGGGGEGIKEFFIIKQIKKPRLLFAHPACFTTKQSSAWEGALTFNKFYCLSQSLSQPEMKIADKQNRQNKGIVGKTTDQEDCHPQNRKPAKKQLIHPL